MNLISVKHWIKYFLIISGLVVMLGLALVTFALIVGDDGDYRRLAIWTVERTAGFIWPRPI